MDKLANTMIKNIYEQYFHDETTFQEWEDHSASWFHEALDNEINIMFSSERKRLLTKFGFAKAIKIYLDRGYELSSKTEEKIECELLFVAFEDYVDNNCDYSFENLQDYYEKSKGK
jgi:hypothetical protein